MSRWVYGRGDYKRDGEEDDIDKEWKEEEEKKYFKREEVASCLESEE